MENIHGYQFDKSKIHNSPNGIWYEAESDGNKYFLKKFQWPKYPREGSNSDVYEMKKRECDDWLEQKYKIITALNEIGDGTGNIVSPREVFREKLCFYQVTYWVEADAKSLDEIKRYSDDDKKMLLKTYSSALKKVHSKKIIHGDLKPDNIMISRSASGKPVAKIIDFDDSYFSGQAFPPDKTICTDAYQSPELAAYKSGHEEYRSVLTCANDVFASGIIFHQFWTGDMPKFEGRESGKFLFQAIAAGQSYEIDSSIPEWLKKLLIKMLDPLPENRPTMENVYQWISTGTEPVVSKSTKKASSVSKKTTSVSPKEVHFSELDNLLDTIPKNLSVYTKESSKRLEDEVDFVRRNRNIIDENRLIKRLKKAVDKLSASDGTDEFSIIPCETLPDKYEKVEIISESKVVAYMKDNKKVTLPKPVALALKLVKRR